MPGPGTKKGQAGRKSGDRPRAFEDSSTEFDTSTSSDDAAPGTLFDPTEFRKSHLEFLAQLKRHKSLFSIISDVDKCYKKIHEGIEAVEQLWLKFETAPSANVRDKCENDLKREIKKLQRLRDQIRGWLGGSDIKDKKILEETKKLIERYMEKFKLAEKEIKTKTYSTVGLSQPDKLDPLDEDAEDARSYLNGKIEELSFLVDTAELELETLQSVDKRRRDHTSIIETQERIGKYRYHVSQLEIVLRLLAAHRIVQDEAKETLPEFLKQVRNLKDHIEHFISNHQDPDFEANEYFYEEFEGLVELKESTVDFTAARDEIKEKDAESEEAIVEMTKELFPSLSSLGDALGSLDCQYLVHEKNGEPTKNEPSLDVSAQRDPYESKDVYPGCEIPVMFTDIVSGRSSSASQFYDAEPHESSYRESQMNSNLVEPAEGAGPSSGGPTSLERSRTNFHGSPVGATCPSPDPIHSPKSRPTSLEASRSSYHGSPIKTGSPCPLRCDSTTHFGIFGDPYSSTPRSASPTGGVSQTSSVAIRDLVFPNKEATWEQKSRFFPSTSDTFASTQSPNVPPVARSVFCPAKKEAFVPSWLGANPLGPAPYTQENRHHLLLLSAAHSKFEKNREDYCSPPNPNLVDSLFRRCPFQTPDYYPQSPLPLESFSTMSDDMLCYAFYQHRGSLFQAEIAKILKSRDFRYHTVEKTWFRRTDQPKVVTQTFEVGTYISFCILKLGFRLRENFRFDYKDLEGYDP